MGIGFWIVLVILIFVILFAIWIVRNLLLQNEQMEDIIVGLKSTIEGYRETAEETLKTMTALDKRQMFEKDDDVGVIFKQMVKLIKGLNAKL